MSPASELFGSCATSAIVSLPFLTLFRPTVVPPCVILNLTLCGCSFTYFAASRATSGYEDVAPLMVTSEVALAAAGAATPTTPATVRATERRRIRCISERLRFRIDLMDV